MDKTLPYPNLMGATIDSLVEETCKTGLQVAIVINYNSEETRFLFSQTLKTGHIIEASYTYKREQDPLRGLTRIFTAYYHLIKVAKQLS